MSFLITQIIRFRQELIMIALALTIYLVTVTWINNKAEEKFQEFVRDFKVEQEKITRDLAKDFRDNTDKLIHNLNKDKEETRDVIEQFKNESNANDDSGIHGRFLRQ